MLGLGIDYRAKGVGSSAWGFGSTVLALAEAAASMPPWMASPSLDGSRERWALCLLTAARGKRPAAPARLLSAAAHDRTLDPKPQALDPALLAL